MNDSKMALKPFIDAINVYCDSLSKKELMDMIIRLAKEVSADSRMEFLRKIKSCPLEESPVTQPDDDVVDQMLDDIAELRESIEDRIVSIENGDYWDDYDEVDPMSRTKNFKFKVYSPSS